MIGAGIGERRRQTRFDSVEWQRLHDDAGRKWEDLRRRHVEPICQRLAGRARSGQPFGAGARVRIAGVDHKGPNVDFRSKMLPTDLDRRRTKAVAGEHACDTGPLIQEYNRQVFAAGLANRRLRRAKTDTRYGTQISWVRCRQVDRHGELSE